MLTDRRSIKIVTAKQPPIFRQPDPDTLYGVRTMADFTARLRAATEEKRG